jgi:hypothetical protein
LNRGEGILVDIEAMSASAMLLIRVLLCRVLGTTVGYFYRYRLELRRFLTLIVAILIFPLFEITSGTLSSKYSLQENLVSQLDVLPPFAFLYLRPRAFDLLSSRDGFRPGRIRFVLG